MKKSKIHSIGLLMLAALFSTTSCDSSDDTETTGPVVCPTDQTTTTILNASINKAFPLFAAVDAVTKANENFTISSLSLSEMLAMASNGANSETRKQINSIIGVNDNISKESLNEAFNSLNDYLAKVDDKTTFATANSVWIDEGFNVKPEFLNDKKLIGETFYQKLSTVKTMDDINNWCDVKTRGCIKEILTEPLASKKQIKQKGES